MGRTWKNAFSSPEHSSQNTPPPNNLDAAHDDHDQAQATSLSSLLRSSSRKDPCNRLYRKAALLPDQSTTTTTASPSNATALQRQSLEGNTSVNPDMTYPPSAPYRRDAEARASRSASNVANGTSATPGGPVKTMSPQSDRPGGPGRYVDYNDISDDDDESHLRSPVSAAAVHDAVSLQRQTQQRMASGAAIQPEHWVPAPGSQLPNGNGPHPPSSGGVRGNPQLPGSGPGPNRGRPPSFSGGRADELAVAGATASGRVPSQSPSANINNSNNNNNNPNSGRPAQRSGPVPNPAGGNRRQHNSRSPPNQRNSSSQQQQQQQRSSTHNGGPPPAMLNVSNPPQRLPTPSVAESVLRPLEQKVGEYSSLMREAEDQVDRLDDEIRALQDRRAAAESRYMEAKARHDEYRSQHSDVERALRGDLPPLTPMLPPLPQGQVAPSAGPRVNDSGMTTQQLQRQQRMQQRASMGSLDDQYHYEQERAPQDNMNGMNRRKQSGQYERPMSQSSAGESMRDGSNKKGKGRFRFSLFG